MAAISTLTGDFTNAAWGSGVGFSKTLDSTRLEMDPTLTGSLTTAAGYDLTGSVFSWKYHWLNPATGTADVHNFDFRDAGTASTGYRVLKSLGTWRFQKAAVQVGNTWTDLVMRASPYCRIRESAGTTFFEISANGVSGWAQPDATQNTANYTTITNIFPRFVSPTSPGTDIGLEVVQEVNGTAVPAVAGDGTIHYMQSTITAAAAALNTSPTAPTVSTGDLSILVIAGKLTAATTATSTTPSGWTIIGAISQSGTAAANAADTGDTAVVMYQRQDSGYAAPTISTTGFNSMASSIVVYRSQKVALGGTWDVSQTTTGSDTSSGANIAITGAAGIAVSAGDVVVAGFANSGDIGTTSAYTIAGMSGVTISTNATETPSNVAVTTGNDSRLIVSHAPITAGSSASAPTYALTNASVSTGHARFLRLRDVAPASISSLVDDFNDNSIDSAKWTTSVSGTGTVTETSARMSVAAANGVNIAELRSAQQLYLNDVTVKLLSNQSTLGTSSWVLMWDTASSLTAVNGTESVLWSAALGFKWTASSAFTLTPRYATTSGSFTNGTPFSYTNADEAAEPYLRITADSTNVTWYSGTGTSWTQRAQVAWSSITGIPTGVAMTGRLRLAISGGSTGSTQTIDDFNILPTVVFIAPQPKIYSQAVNRASTY